MIEKSICFSLMMRMMLYRAKKIFFCILLILLCSFSSFQKKSTKILGELLFELENIHTINELLDKEIILQKQFDKVVDLLIEAKKFQVDGINNETLSNSLQKNLQRLYEIDGGQEIIEYLQYSALQRLNGFEKILE